jgi:hypothetical protein
MERADEVPSSADRDQSSAMENAGNFKPDCSPLARNGVPRVPISAVEPELSEGRGLVCA